MNGIREHPNHQNIVLTKNAGHLTGIRKGNMPKIGEVKKASEVGGHGGSKKIWQACSVCGIERWVFFRIRKGKPLFTVCRNCRASSRKFHYPPPKGTIDSPITGDVRPGKEVGRASQPTTSFIWHPLLLVPRKSRCW